MKKPSKGKIIAGIQLFITMTMVFFGFWFSYLLIWFKCGLPIEWWSLFITMMLALFSMGGLFQWIYMCGDDNA